MLLGPRGRPIVGLEIYMCGMDSVTVDNVARVINWRKRCGFCRFPYDSMHLNDGIFQSGNIRRTE